MDIIERIVPYLVGVRYEDLPPAVVKSAKMEVLDTLGVLLAGFEAPGCPTIVNRVKEWGGKEESTILVHGGKVPAPNAALVNSTMARAQDYDVTIPGGVHTGAAAIPTALATAEMSGNLSGKEFLTAIALGDDLAVRLHLAIPERRFEPTGICMVFGAAVIAGRILSLKEREMRDALGMALAQAGGSFQGNVDGALAVRLAQGLVSRAGVESAIWAKNGITGARNIIDGKHGFLRLFADKDVKAEALTQALGQRFEGASRISFKPFPSGNLVNSPTWATLQLVAEHNITPEQVSEVIVGLTPFAYDVVGESFIARDKPQVDAQFSAAYAVANALVRKSSRLEHFADNAVGDPEVLTAAARVRCQIDQQVVKEGGDPGAAWVEIRLNNGKKYSLKVEYPKGRPQNPLSEEEIKQKFRDCLLFARAISAAEGEEIIQIVDRLETAGHLLSIIKLLSQNKHATLR